MSILGASAVGVAARAVGVSGALNHGGADVVVAVLGEAC